MGYESNFEVPDIEDTLLRGVDDLTDLLCPDSHPEDYASRGYQGYQGTCVFFCFFSLTLRGFFSRETKKDRRVYERLPGIFSSRNAIGKGKNRFGLSFCPSRVCAWGAKSARGEERCARSQRERDWEGEFFFSFLKFSEKKHGQRLTLFFFPRAALETNRNQSIPTAPVSSGPRPGPRTRRDICTGSDWITDSGGTRETIREGD